jgi:16S rRNA processing protein RimM
MIKKILLGRCGAAQGVKGEIRIKSFTQDPLSIAAYGPLMDEDGASLEIEHARALKDDLVVARLKGVTDRTSAETLTGKNLFVAREKLPPPDEDEFYISDLIGLAARAPDGAAIGVVKNVLNYGAGDILEIKPETGEVFLLAFTKENAPTLDFTKGEIVIVVAPDEET